MVGDRISGRDTRTRAAEVRMTDAVAVVLAFNDAINSRDLAALSELMTESHRFVDSEGAVVDGRNACVEAWRGSFDSFPDYHNFFDHVTDLGDGVVLVRGRSECSVAPLDGPAEWRAGGPRRSHRRVAGVGTRPGRALSQR
jgi:ketosteroid isomerase-like protein